MYSAQVVCSSFMVLKGKKWEEERVGSVDEMWLENRCRRSLENVQNGNDVRVLLLLCASLPPTSPHVRKVSRTRSKAPQSNQNLLHVALCGGSCKRYTCTCSLWHQGWINKLCSPLHYSAFPALSMD